MLVPKLREDISLEIYYENDKKFVALSDDLGIASQALALPEDIYEYLQKVGEKLKIDDAEDGFKKTIGTTFPDGFFTNIVAYLEQNYFLETPTTRLYRDDVNEYLKSDVRPPVCAGSSYPVDENELKKYLKQIFAAKSEEPKYKAKKIIAPHIDFQIGTGAHQIYANTFSALDTDFDLAVILGTAHYKSSDDFMFTRKDFATPLGKVKTDTDFLDSLQESLDFDLTYDDLAHRPEHSLELHILLLQYLMGKKEFKILPILTGSYHQYFEENQSPEENENFDILINKLNEEILKNEKKVIFLASGDLSHTGRKFNHDYNAKDKIKETEQVDEQVIRKLVRSQVDSFYHYLKSTKNQTNICGLSPFYSMLKLTDAQEGHLAGYYNWHEDETESSVTFCGVTYK